jgi:hypothetical protein
MQYSEQRQNQEPADTVPVQGEDTSRHWLYLTSSFPREGIIYVTTLTFPPSISPVEKEKHITSPFIT